ncbi:hypothetical protein KBD18_00325 [Patescibacteria group bacterium]|nr:hypothetical protein [Patescibacteria group bacterium]
MKRPFEAVGSVLCGLFVFAGIVAAFHIVTGRAVSWELVVILGGAFILGAYTTRNLWK